MNMTKNILLLMMSLCLMAFGVSAENDEVAALPKLLDLGAHKCIPCQKMAPILDELTQEYAAEFVVEFIDVWQPENKEKAMAYGIRAIPTQIFFDETGDELWRHEGFLSKDEILNKWAELGYEFDSSTTEREASAASSTADATPCCGS
jgi:thioredoxin 1